MFVVILGIVEDSPVFFNMWPETDSSMVDLWGETRSKHTHDTLALEALSGWEPTNCGAGVVRGPNVSKSNLNTLSASSRVHILKLLSTQTDSSGSYS